MRILGLGHCPVDVLYRTDRAVLPPAEWAAYRRPVLRAGGGSMANTLCLLGELGHEPHLLATVGDDDGADFLEHELKRHGVVPHLLRKRGRRTPTIACLVRADGDRDFAYDWDNAPADVTVADLRRSRIDAGKFAVFATELFEASARRLAGFAKRVVFSGQIVTRPTVDRKRQAALFETCAGLSVVSLQYMDDWERVRARTRAAEERSMRKYVGFPQTLPLLRITTQGSQGIHAAVAYSRGKALKQFEQPIPRKVRVLDTTGAGDAFLGALLHKLGPRLRPSLEQLKAACRAAQRVAGLACTHWGARGYLSDMAAVRRALG